MASTVTGSQRYWAAVLVSLLVKVVLCTWRGSCRYKSNIRLQQITNIKKHCVKDFMIIFVKHVRASADGHTHTANSRKRQKKYESRSKERERGLCQRSWMSLCLHPGNCLNLKKMSPISTVSLKTAEQTRTQLKRKQETIYYGCHMFPCVFLLQLFIREASDNIQKGCPGLFRAPVIFKQWGDKPGWKKMCYGTEAKCPQYFRLWLLSLKLRVQNRDELP